MTALEQLRDLNALDGIEKQAIFGTLGRLGAGTAGAVGRGVRGLLFGGIAKKGPWAGKLMAPRGVAFNPSEWTTAAKAEIEALRRAGRHAETKLDLSTGVPQYLKRKVRFGGLAGVVQQNPMLSLLGAGMGYMYLSTPSASRYAPAMDAAQNAQPGAY